MYLLSSQLLILWDTDKLCMSPLPQPLYSYISSPQGTHMHPISKRASH
jgi:hypothetical protein